MVKIPRVFDNDGSVFPNCEWVLTGEGYATVKLDGTAVMIDEDGKFWKRRALKKKRKDNPPADWIPAEPRPRQGRWNGWVPVGESPEDTWHWRGFRRLKNKKPGTYELVGPRVNGNNELLKKHYLVPHGQIILDDCPRTREGLIEYLSDKDIEGIVFYHPDGRMAKVRKDKDLGIPRRDGRPDMTIYLKEEQ